MNLGYFSFVHIVMLIIMLFFIDQHTYIIIDICLKRALLITFEKGQGFGFVCVVYITHFG